MKKKSLSLLFITLCILLFSTACKKNENGGWSTDILAPLISTDLSIANLVGDTLVNVNSDNSINLVFKKNIFSFNFSDYLLDIPDTGISKKFTLDSLRLPSQTFTNQLSLGFLARGLISTGTTGNIFLGNYIISNNGDSIVFPALSGLTIPPTAYDASLFFKEADLIRGHLLGYIVNRFPVPLTNIHYQLFNTVGGGILVDDIIPYIAPKDSAYVDYDMAGKHIESNFTVNVINFSTPGSSPEKALVDTTDYIELRFGILGFYASSATAIFPSIDVLASTEDVTQTIPGGAKLTYIEAEEGLLHVFINSSVQEGLNLTYKLEGAYDKMGRPLVVSTFVPPAPIGSLSTVDRSFDLSGYSIDLTGKFHNTFNTYTQSISARIDSSGILRTITSSDSLKISYTLEKIKPKLIKGYAGNDTISVGPQSSAFDFLSGIKSGNINLDDVKLSLNVENGIGVKGDLLISDFTAKKGASSVALVAPSIMNTRHSIAKALEFPFTPSNTNFLLNKSNSNIKSLFELLPNMLQYAMKVYVNPAGNDGTYQDFVNASSRLNVNLNMEIPLNLIANNLTLVDTIDFSLGGSIDQMDAVKEGTLNLIAYNGYPLEATLTMIVYDEYFGVVDTLVNKYVVQAADLNSSCKVSGEKRSIAKILIDEARTANLKQGKKALIIAKFSTINNQASCDNHLKIYSDYKLRMKLTGDFQYDIKSKF